MKLLNSLNIKVRITGLLILGILFLFINTTVNLHLDKKKNQVVAVGSASRTIAHKITTISTLEAEYLLRNHSSALESIKTERVELDEAIAALQRDRSDEQFRTVFTEIVAAGKEREITFSKAVENADAMNASKASFLQDMQKISDILQSLVNLITQQETQLLMTEGASLSAPEGALRDQLKQVAASLGAKITALQNLFLFSDIESYNHSNPPLQKKLKGDVKNLKIQLAAQASAKYKSSWEQAEQLLSLMEKKEESLADLYVSKLELSANLESGNKHVQGLAALSAQIAEELLKQNSRRNVSLAVGSLVVQGVILLLLGTLLIRSTQNTLTQAINGLNQSADMVVATSSQVSSASQEFADGASEQAAALEETSATLEQMATMIKRTAENTIQANDLTQAASGIVERANIIVNELTLCMKEISDAGQQTCKIIKTIYDIAFQTRLLSLNAAVESARAGEAGNGFAVVANEVRNLAMRTADSAKQTETLIMSSIAKLSSGEERVIHTHGAIFDLSHCMAKVAGLVNEIATASSEQALGIEEINKAVAEIDRVTQLNSGNANESAANSEEMNTQAKTMKFFIGDLANMVGLRGGQRGVLAVRST